MTEPITVQSAPNGGVWWWQDSPIGRLTQREAAPGHCGGCGRQMVETIEHDGYAHDGRPKYHRWYSCPRYLVSSWKAAFLPGYGMGHDSYDADEPLLERVWA